MARILLTVWPFAGHIHPNIALAQALRARGHEVAFYSGSRARSTVEGEGFAWFPLRRVAEAEVERLVQSPEGIISRPGPARLKAMWRAWVLDTVPAQVADLDELLASWGPALIVSDPTVWAPFLVLREGRRIPVAIFGLTPACMLPGRDGPVLGWPIPRSHSLAGRVRRRLLRAMAGFFLSDIRREADRLRHSYGLAPMGGSVTSFSGQVPLYLVPGSPEFDYQRTDLPPSVQYIGPCLWSKPSDQPPPAWLTSLPADQPLVYVTEGTIPQQARLLRAAAQGLAGRPMQVVMTTGRQRTPAALDLGTRPLAANIRVEQWVPVDDLVPRIAALVTNGGPGTLLAALIRGVPVVVVPADWDHPETAWRVVEAGVGLRLTPRECTPERLRKAVEQVLGDPAFRRNARRIAESFTRCGGPARAARLIEELVPAGALAGTGAA